MSSLPHQPLSANQRFVLALGDIGVMGIGWLKVAPAQPPPTPGATVPQVVTARAFQVVDKTGRIRIELGVSGEKDGAAQIRLCNKENRVAAELEIDEADRAHVVLAGADGKHQAVLTSTSQGPGLMMGTSKGEQPRLHLLVDDNGQPHIRLWNVPGKYHAAQVALEPQTP